MIYGSVCSGIEAATVAWHPLGWRPAFFSEIEPFPKRVLAHHYPTVPDLGDFTTIKDHAHDPIDLLVGGTPCQSFSVAGLRKGLDDPRGNLMLEFGALARRLHARWVVWENVPGVLSSNGGRDFGAFLGMLGELGYGYAYRVLDAQFFGVAQRRRRVFVVGHAGGLWQRAAAVLFEREGLRGDPAPSREAREGGACRLTDRPDRGGANSEGQRLVAMSLNAHPSRSDAETETLIPFDPLQVTSKANRSTCTPGAPMHTLPAAPAAPAVAFGVDIYNHAVTGDVAATMMCASGIGPSVVTAFPWQLGGTMQMQVDVERCGSLVKNQVHAVHAVHAVRRLTPCECERLQGFPDDYTAIPGAADGPRYRALGNSMAIPVIRWIGERLALVDAACKANEEAA